MDAHNIHRLLGPANGGLRDLLKLELPMAPDVDEVAALRIGFTGTREGMTDRQKTALRELLASYPGAILHHGDAIGADAEAHDIAVALGCAVVIHPPENERQRAFKPAAGSVTQALSYPQQAHRA